MAFGYPVLLDLTDVPVLLVGGGTIALRKAAGLADAGAHVTVVAPEVLPGLRALAVTVHERPYAAGEAGGYRLVITATSEAAVNAQVAADAREAGVWVNSADDPQNCSFILPAVARRGPVVVAVSTGGASPALAGHLRDLVAETVLTEQVEAAAAALARQRADIHAAGGSTEDVQWGQRVRDALAAPDGC
ncbi:MAG: bifunctional precorrin-2 dehydrogenase/sirohydrochlorin ferrochelatase [Actinomycetota bacterium]|nr:bifunctional precorrin-2 dehydrogenase/sirohydrochlorin ferrochelatase [Actinomycetota bacterium]